MACLIRYSFEARKGVPYVEYSMTSLKLGLNRARVTKGLQRKQITNSLFTVTRALLLPFHSINILVPSHSGSPNMASTLATKRLFQEYKLLTSSPPDGITAGPISENNLLHWEALIAGPSDTPYAGGIFPASLIFPPDYPLSPPVMKFLCDIWHPNVYANGTVCISILHAPGEDPNHYESASERWSPIQSTEKILISVMSMLAEPNDESPANVEAAVMWRERRGEFERVVRERVRRGLGL